MSDNNFEDLIGLTTIEKMREGAKIQRMNQGTGCFTCDYTGYTKRHDGLTIMCDCMKQKMFQGLFKIANVPLSYYNKTVDDWTTRTDAHGNDLGPQQTTSEKVYSLLKFYDKNLARICSGNDLYVTHSGNIREKLHSLIFEGNIGSGKTFIASVLIQSAIKKGLSAKYYDWSDLMQYLVDFDKRSEVDQINEEFKTYDFIALDGVEIYAYMPNQMIPQLDRLCKSRLNSGKPIVIMSFGNLTSFNGGSGWASLLKNCITVRLPNVVR